MEEKDGAAWSGMSEETREPQRQAGPRKRRAHGFWVMQEAGYQTRGGGLARRNPLRHTALRAL